MKILMSVDMEGIAGVTDPDDVNPGARDWPLSRARMALEANAAIAGAFEAGATTVLVADSHSGSRNIVPEALDPRAQLIRGFLRPLAMVEGVQVNAAAAVFVGYHGRAGTDTGVLSHTFSEEVREILLNGRPMGEIGINALLCGEFGVPVSFVSGDTAACEEAVEYIGPQVTTCAVKEGIFRLSAISKHPEVACQEIREGVAKSVRNVGELSPFVVPTPHHWEVEWRTELMAKLVSYVPSVKEAGPYRTTFTCERPSDAMRALVVQIVLARSLS